jgi:hypothetical protein
MYPVKNCEHACDTVGGEQLPAVQYIGTVLYITILWRTVSILVPATQRVVNGYLHYILYITVLWRTMSMPAIQRVVNSFLLYILYITILWRTVSIGGW